MLGALSKRCMLSTWMPGLLRLGCPMVQDKAQIGVPFCSICSWTNLIFALNEYGISFPVAVTPEHDFLVCKRPLILINCSVYLSNLFILIILYSVL